MELKPNRPPLIMEAAWTLALALILGGLIAANLLLGPALEEREKDPDRRAENRRRQAEFAAGVRRQDAAKLARERELLLSALDHARAEQMPSLAELRAVEEQLFPAPPADDREAVRLLIFRREFGLFGSADTLLARLDPELFPRAHAVARLYRDGDPAAGEQLWPGKEAADWFARRYRLCYRNAVRDADGAAAAAAELAAANAAAAWRLTFLGDFNLSGIVLGVLVLFLAWSAFRFGGGRPGPGRSPQREPAAAQLARGVRTFLIWLALFLVLGSQFTVSPAGETRETLFALLGNYLLMAGAGMFAACAFYFRRGPGPVLRWLEQGNRLRSPPREMAWGAAGALAAFPLAWLGEQLAPTPPASGGHFLEWLLLSGRLALVLPPVWLLIGVAAPLFEEFFFRGLLLTACRPALGPAGAVAVSAALFAAAHAFGDPAQLPALFLLGLALGVVYQRTGSFLAVVVMHALHNTLVLLQAVVLFA